MGRWAQRRRAGGGPPLYAEIFIIEAHQSGDLVTLTYSGPVTDSDFNVADFVSEPSSTGVDSLSNVGVNELQLTLSTNPGVDTEIVYTGTVSGVRTPQTVTYT